MSYIFIGLIAAAILGTAGYYLIKQWREAAQNKKFPEQSLTATVEGKRKATVQQPADIHPKHAQAPSSKFYATFRFESGQTQEFQISIEQFGRLLDGDKGTLRYQGTRYIGFDRHP